MLRNALSRWYRSALPAGTRIAVDRLIGRPRKWTLALVLLTNDDVQNFVRRLQLNVLDRYGVEIAPPHITLKLGFEVSDLEPYERYFDGLAREIEPFEIRVSGINRFEESRFDEGIIFLEVEKSRELEALRKQVVRDLQERFGIEPYRLEGDEFRFHVTLAYGLSERNFHRAYAELKDLPFQASFRTATICMLVHTGAGWIPYKQAAVAGPAADGRRRQA